jgi:large subunit ribosomal protein L6
MSRIGKMPIPLVSAVKIAIDGNTVSVTGPNGSLSHTLPRGISIENEGEALVLSRTDDSKQQRAYHGLARALLANAVEGVSKGFSKKLEIHGIGYRAEVAGKTLKLTLGYSHPIVFPIPDTVKITVEKNTKLTVTGCDRQQVGQIAANVRAFRKPDVYKQKGIRYEGERLRKKAGKTAAK